MNVFLECAISLKQVLNQEDFDLDEDIIRTTSYGIYKSQLI